MSSNFQKNAKFVKVVALYKASAYNVYTNTDSNEGRGQTVKIGSFADKSDAVSFAKRKSVMGSPADVKLEQVEILVPVHNSADYDWSSDWSSVQVIDGTLEPLNMVDPKKKREEILKKLTPEEREFLGFK